jgi:hypothetical protein
MKLTIGKLRLLIREVISQQSDVPGRYRGDGEYSEVDLERLGHGGHPSYFNYEELDEEDDPGANTNQ